jgi:hypothetical protein
LLNVLLGSEVQRAWRLSCVLSRLGTRPLASENLSGRPICVCGTVQRSLTPPVPWRVLHCRLSPGPNPAWPSRITLSSSRAKQAREWGTDSGFARRGEQGDWGTEVGNARLSRLAHACVARDDAATAPKPSKPPGCRSRQLGHFENPPAGCTVVRWHERER